MNRLRTLAVSVNDFWLQPLRPEPLALFRVLLGLTGCLCLLSSLAPDLELYLGADGLCPPAGLDDWLRRTGRFSLLRGPVGLPVVEAVLPAPWADDWTRWSETFPAARLLFGAWVVSLGCVTVGLVTRPATIVAWVLTVTFHNRLGWVLNGGDALLRMGLFYLMLTPAGAAWSIDRWLHRRADAATVAAWPIRLMQIHVCLIYLATGLGKVNADWVSGEAVYWLLNDVALARWPYCWLPVPLVLCRLASWGTLLFEIGFVFIVPWRRLRPWLLAAGVALHVGIWVTTEVGWFSPLMLCWYALFLPAEVLRPRSRSCIRQNAVGCTG